MTQCLLEWKSHVCQKSSCTFNKELSSERACYCKNSDHLVSAMVSKESYRPTVKNPEGHCDHLSKAGVITCIMEKRGKDAVTLAHPNRFMSEKLKQALYDSFVHTLLVSRGKLFDFGLILELFAKSGIQSNEKGSQRRQLYSRDNFIYINQTYSWHKER